MIKIYDGSGKTTYILNSGRVIDLDDGELDELVVGSEKILEVGREKIKELQDKIMELELKVAYNSYMDELIELENRNCANCNLYDQGYGCLENGNVNFKPSSDFYCNKWKEAKNEKISNSKKSK